MFQMALRIPRSTETMIQMSVALTKQLTECGLDGSASLNLSQPASSVLPSLGVLIGPGN